jgi:hypothetical protein
MFDGFAKDCLSSKTEIVVLTRGKSAGYEDRIWSEQELWDYLSSRRSNTLHEIL